MDTPSPLTNSAVSSAIRTDCDSSKEELHDFRLQRGPTAPPVSSDLLWPVKTM